MRRLSRKTKFSILISIDFLAITSSYVLIYYLFFDIFYLSFHLLYGSFFAFCILFYFKMYSEILSQSGIYSQGYKIFLASLLSNLIFLISSESTLIIMLLSTLLSSIILIVIRSFGSLSENSISTFQNRLAIYGAGRAGSQLDLALSKSNMYQVAFFIDDDESLIGRVINGKPVLSVKELKNAFTKYNVNEVILVIPSLKIERKREIIKSLIKYNIKINTVPSINDIMSGKDKISNIIPFTINDLLGRSTVKANVNLLSKSINNEVVLITGAGGSIGSELSKQIIKLKPLKLILFDNSEHSLYQIERKISEMRISCEIVSVLGSILDSKLLERMQRQHGITMIFHAAAYKHVPLVEKNITQGVRNNIVGTLCLVEFAEKFLIKRFTLISTDKAVRPTNIMGATKRFCELIVQAKANNYKNKTIFSMVRFGNVLGSSGSVVPLFKEQIEAGGPVTLTHKSITRYFMSIPEAAELVIQSSAMAKGGEVFVLDMGDPVKIYDLAVAMIKFSGLSVKNEKTNTGDIKIEISGLRPGEKLYEELVIGDNISKTDHPKIMNCTEPYIELEEILKVISQLRNYIEQDSTEGILAILEQYVNGFSQSN